MPIVLFLRLFGSLISLGILAGAAYLGWRWTEGTDVALADGSIVVIRENWQLWTAVALLGLSLFGRMLLAPLLGKPDTDRTKIKLAHGQGTLIDSPTGAKLYVEIIGDSSQPTLLFTHGWGLDSTIWAYAKRDMPGRFNLAFWDLPGTGKSRPGPDGRLDPDRFAADLAAVVEFTGAERIALVGHSIGGMTIQSFMQTAPEPVRNKIAGIALLNTTFTNPLETMIASGFFKAIRWPVLEPQLLVTRLLQPIVWLDAWRAYLSGWAHVANRVQFGKTVTRSQLEAVTLLGTRNPQGALAKGNQGMFRWDATGAMSKVQCPVLVIGGEKDIVTKPQASRDIAGDAPGAQLMLVPNVNHNGFLENADVYNSAIVGFATRVLTRSAKSEALADEEIEAAPHAQWLDRNQSAQHPTALPKSLN